MHTSVLLREVIDGLAIEKGDIVVDATLGGAGHAEAILQTFGGSITFIGLDADNSAIERSSVRLKTWQSSITLVQANFRDIDAVVGKLGISKINRILFDLGISSFQLEDSGRGISFSHDEPLVMTLMDTPGKDTLTADDIVNTWHEEAIANVIYAYGEERYARRIAEGIVEARKIAPIKTTFELVEIIKAHVPKVYVHGKRHYATKTFQALRIAVNDELDTIRTALEKSFQLLAPKGRMAVISFHSLEDRIVKHFIVEKKESGLGISIHKKPLQPSLEEKQNNPRSRSAKLRIVEKI